MKTKEIPNMGKIIFDKFYNSSNIVITDINMSPIKNSKLIKIVDENTANKLINNYYIYSAGNVTYTSAGHSDMDKEGTDAEMELFVNTFVNAASPYVFITLFVP